MDSDCGYGIWVATMLIRNLCGCLPYLYEYWYISEFRVNGRICRAKKSNKYCTPMSDIIASLEVLTGDLLKQEAKWLRAIYILVSPALMKRILCVVGPHAICENNEHGATLARFGQFAESARPRRWFSHVTPFCTSPPPSPQLQWRTKQCIHTWQHTWSTAAQCYTCTPHRRSQQHHAISKYEWVASYYRLFSRIPLIMIRSYMFKSTYFLSLFRYW